MLDNEKPGDLIILSHINLSLSGVGGNLVAVHASRLSSAFRQVRRRDTVEEYGNTESRI